MFGMLSLEKVMENDNSNDKFAVAVSRNNTIVGHVPRKFSSFCSIFLRKGGSVMCEVTGRRQYSLDLPQGGMEIPCVYVFNGDEGDITKV